MLYAPVGANFKQVKWWVSLGSTHLRLLLTPALPHRTIGLLDPARKAGLVAPGSALQLVAQTGADRCQVLQITRQRDRLGNVIVFVDGDPLAMARARALDYSWDTILSGLLASRALGNCCRIADQTRMVR